MIRSCRSRADGTEELSETGKERLGAVMVEFQRYPRNGALIIEGYSGKGSLGEQLLVSTDRALKVREYLVKKFHLNPTTWARPNWRSGLQR